MPVEFTCDGCNRRLRAPDAKAGKRTNCPTCGKDLLIPVMGTAAPISLPSAGMPVHNPLDKLAAALPTASEAAAGFNLSKPGAPQAPIGPANVRPQAEPIEIGLASDDPQAPGSISSSGVAPANPSGSSSSGIGSAGKSKANAWRGGDKAPLSPGAAPKPVIPAPLAPKPTIPAAPTAAPKPMMLDIPAKPSPLSLPMAGIPMAGAMPMASAVPASPLIPVAPTAPNPLDDIFKDIPQLAPVNTAAPFGNLKPVTTMDPFAAQGAALPQASAPRWDQIASSASVGSNPFASPSASASGGGYRRGADIESVRTMVMIPGIFLLISYIFLLMGTIVRIALTVLGLVLISSDQAIRNRVANETGGAGIALEVLFAILFFALAVSGLFGAIKMIRVRSRGAAMTAAVMAIFPFCLCCPIGIWAVVVLSQENVQRAFEANDRRHGG